MEAINQLRSLVSGGQDLRLTSLHHGTTVATNGKQSTSVSITRMLISVPPAILEGKGARVALFVTEGYHDILQMRRSQVPGGLGGWVIYPKPEPLASLELVSSNTRDLDVMALRRMIRQLKFQAVYLLQARKCGLLILKFSAPVSKSSEIFRRIVDRKLLRFP